MSCYSISHFKLNLNHILWSEFPLTSVGCCGSLRNLWNRTKKKHHQDQSLPSLKNIILPALWRQRDLVTNCLLTVRVHLSSPQTSWLTHPWSSLRQGSASCPRSKAHSTGETVGRIRPTKTSFSRASIHVKMAKDCHLPIITLSNFLYSINLRFLENCQQCLRGFVVR